MASRQWLGFLGFLGFIGVGALMRGDWLQSLWLVWFVWFLYFIPRSPAAPGGHASVLQNTRTSEGPGLANTQQLAEKARHLDRVMVLARQHEEITNNEVQQDLGVSDATAERYLNELEHQGKLVQVGTTGSAVRYRLPA